MNRREARAELACTRAALPEPERRRRIIRALESLREEMLGLATVEVTAPQAHILVLTVRGLDGEVLAEMPAAPPVIPVGALGTIR